MPSSSTTDPILPPDAFVRFVQEQFAAANLVALRRAELDLAVVLYGREVGLSLEGVYADYRRNPRQLASLVGALIQKVLDYSPDHLITQYSALQQRIFPMLKRMELLATVRERNIPMLAYRPWQAELMLAYVIHERESIAYINESHLERWNIDEPTLHKGAIANLQQLALEPTWLGSGTKRLAIIETQDGYAATRLLLTDMLLQWQPEFPGTMVLGIPTRDLLIAFSDAESATVDAIVQQIQVDMMQHPAGLTEQLFTIVNGQVEPYRWRKPEQ